jgi:AcrR family transcriptional regulator
MTLISEHIEPDTRERILVVAERLFRQIGYQKTTVADIASSNRRRRFTRASRAA